MSGIERSSQFADAHPPGESSATSQNKVISTAAKVTQNEVIKNIVDVIKTPFDIIAWITGNWQLAVIGVVAIFILIRD